MKLTMLGTGNALVTECYNTCFLIEDRGQTFMVDGGGGNTILHQIKHAGYDWMDLRHIFVTHKHVDHLMGIIWMVRMICQFMDHGEYKGEAYIYSHGEVLNLIRDMADKLLQKKESAFIDDRLHLVEVSDGETLDIIDHKFTFFDIQSTKAKQYGFRMELEDGKMLTCCGDEPLTACVEKYAEGSEWMLHEAFCLHSQADIFDPYEKHSRFAWLRTAILPSTARKFSVRLWNRLRTLKKTVGTLWTAGIQRLPYAKAYSDTARALLRLEWWLKSQ